MAVKKKKELPLLHGDFSIYAAPRIKGNPNPLANDREVEWFAVSTLGGPCNLGNEQERINIRLAAIHPEDAPSYPKIDDAGAFEKRGLSVHLPPVRMRVIVKPVLLTGEQVDSILVSNLVDRLDYNEKKLVRQVYPQLAGYPNIDLAVPAELDKEDDPKRFYPLDSTAYAVVDRQQYRDLSESLWVTIGNAGFYHGLKPDVIAAYMKESAEYISALDLKDCGPKGKKLLLAMRYHGNFDRPIPYVETDAAREILARGIISEKFPSREAGIALKKIRDQQPR